jgi:transcriptional regulator with XRE-family HTH domain
MPNHYRGTRSHMIQRHHRWHESLLAAIEPVNGNPKTTEINVGQRLRELRAQQNLSVRSLAELSGLNFNTLSLIENGKSSPSVSTLQHLAGALGVPIAAFFETSTEVKEVLFQKSGQRPKAEFAHGLLEDLGNGLMLGDGVPLLISLNPMSDSGKNTLSHTGQEFVYCLEGDLQYTIGDQVFQLESGDSLIFEAHLPHRWENKSQAVSRFLLVLCPSDKMDTSAKEHFRTEMKKDISNHLD